MTHPVQPDPDALVELVVIAEATATHPPGTPLDEHGNPIPADTED